ncbi:head GIN domain-containing protein [Chitinophaga lutea]
MNTYCKILLSCLVLPLFLAGCGETVSGSRNVAKEDRQLEKFARVSLAGSMDIYVTKGDSYNVTIEAEDNLLPLIETRVEGDELVVRFRRNTHVRTHRDVKVYVTTPELEGVDLSGSGDIELKSFFTSSTRMALSISGSGDIKGSFNAPATSIDIAGSGNAQLSGQTRDLSIDIAGSGECRSEDLLSETVNINIAGAGSVRVHASRSIKANIVGSGDVYYKGEPTIETSKIGSGSVKKI